MPFFSTTSGNWSTGADAELPKDETVTDPASFPSSLGSLRGSTRALPEDPTPLVHAPLNRRTLFHSKGNFMSDFASEEPALSRTHSTLRAYTVPLGGTPHALL